ncbi:hypothetical protein F5051DRAFT_379902 [Lentinula edodes]|nr:hypothetical protein F5051DRAFT_379902 [Lentinula edodes]
MFLSSSILSFPGYDMDISVPSGRIQCLTFLSSFVALILVYHVFARPSGFTSSKQVAWIITTTASFVMTIASLPFVWDYFAGRGDVKRVGAFPELAAPANRVFRAYLLADLSLGARYYRSQLNLFTGWSHHVIYLGIVEYAIRQKWAHIFCLAACMEFSTLVLGLATLFPRLPSNIFFAVSFLLTRIFFHTVLCITYISFRIIDLWRSVAPIGSIAPAVLFICVFPMHASWFSGCLKGFKKRAKLRRVIEAKSRGSAASVISLEFYAACAQTELKSTLKSVPYPIINRALSASLAKASSSPESRHNLRRTIPQTHNIYDRYAYYSMRYAHYSSRCAHYRARFRGLGLRGPVSVKEQFSKRLPSLRPTLQRLPSLETLSSLSPLPSPTFEMLAFNFDSVPSLAKNFLGWS